MLRVFSSGRTLPIGDVSLMHDHIVQASFLNVDAWTMKD